MDCPDSCARSLDLITLMRGISELPIRAVTDNTDAEVHALHAGADSIVPKPTSPDGSAATDRRLLERAGAVLSHPDLLEAAWGDPYRGEDQEKLYVSCLRHSLAPAGVDPVETVRGVGYRYDPRRVEP